MMRFEGKVAIVTGAGRAGGIGEAIARRLTSEGATVAVVDLCRDRPDVPREKFGGWDELRAVADSLEGAGRKGLPVRADVTSEDEVAALMEEVEARLGRIDILFNNAGGGTGAGPVDQTPVAALSKADWDYTFAVSLDSVFLCAKHAAPRIARQGGGAIVNTSSISAYHGVAGISAYAAAKYGVTALTRSLAMELAPQRIRVNAFAPGMTLTPYVRQRYAHVAAQNPGTTPEEHMERMVSTRIPLRRPADPSEMASVAAFLASEDASYMTGQTLFVDGGMRV
jgi:NAD(P)-dependent dehydrogenase (short-subunit alcohol dehydrogenase family)